VFAAPCLKRSLALLDKPGLAYKGEYDSYDRFISIVPGVPPFETVDPVAGVLARPLHDARLSSMRRTPLRQVFAGTRGAAPGRCGSEIQSRIKDDPFAATHRDSSAQAVCSTFDRWPACSSCRSDLHQMARTCRGFLGVKRKASPKNASMISTFLLEPVS
jgi:hypothetical protein